MLCLLMTKITNSSIIASGAKCVKVKERKFVLKIMV